MVILFCLRLTSLPLFLLGHDAPGLLLLLIEVPCFLHEVVAVFDATLSLGPVSEIATTGEALRGQTHQQRLMQSAFRFAYCLFDQLD